MALGERARESLLAAYDFGAVVLGPASPGATARGRSGSVTSLFSRDFGEQFVDRLRIVDSNEATEGTPALPPDRMLRGIRQPECATNADPHVPLRLRALSSSHVAPDVLVGQVGEQLHE